MTKASNRKTAGSLLLVLFLAACGNEKGAPVKAVSLPEQRITVAVTQEKQRAATEEVVGTVQSKQRATIAAKLSGRVERLIVSPGQAVKAGDLLLEIEAGDIKAKVDQAEAMFKQTANDLNRMTALLRQNAATRQDYDAAVARERVARAALAEAQTMLGYSKITAPFDGTVTQKFTNIGDLAAPGLPLLELLSPGHLRFETEIPESVIGNISLNKSLDVQFSNPERTVSAVISEVAPAADPRSRTFLVKLDLPKDANLFPGQFGRVRIPVGEVTAITLPASAVLARGQLELVYVVSDNKANMRLIKTGRREGQDVEVLSGLNPGETVAASNAGLLSDGQPVSVMKGEN